MEEMRAPYFDGFPGVRSPLFDASPVDDDRCLRIGRESGNFTDQSTGIRTPRGCFSWNDLGGRSKASHPSFTFEARAESTNAISGYARQTPKFPEATYRGFVLCGYSFRDGHINDTIVQGLQYTRTSIVYAHLLDDMQEYPQAEEIAQPPSEPERTRPRWWYSRRSGGQVVEAGRWGESRGFSYGPQVGRRQ